MRQPRHSARSATALLAATVFGTTLAVGTAHATVITCSNYCYDTSNGTGTLGPALGGSITRAQIIARANDWVSQQLAYSQTEGWVDTAAGGPYRMDCSGFISMAWALPTSMVTSTLPQVATVVDGDVSGDTSLNPGDALDYTADHVVLFDHWTDSSGDFAYDAEHTFGVPSDQETDSIYSSQLEGYAISDFEQLQYNKLSTATPPPPTGTLLELHTDGSIWEYGGSGGVHGWSELDDNTQTKAVAQSTGNIYELHKDGSIWSYTGGGIHGWTQIGNNSAATAIAASGNHLYELDTTGTIWSYNGGGTTGWARIAGNAAARAIAASQNNLYELDSTGTIWSYSGSGGTTGWSEIDDNTTTVGVTANGTAAYELHKDGSIWQYNGGGIHGWTQIGNNSAAVSIRVSSGGTLVELDSTGTIWSYYGGGTTGWIKTGNNAAAVKIAIAYNNSLFELDRTGYIWGYNGTPITGWSVLDTNAKATAISSGPDNSAHL